MNSDIDGGSDREPTGVVGRFMALIRNNLAVSGAIGAALLAVVAWLAFGIFGVHTLFIDDEVDEANPFADALVDPDAEAAADPATDGTADPVDDPADDAAVETNLDGAPETTPTTTEAPAPTITTEASGSFISLDHPTSGDAVVITNGEQRFLRFENFETDNGPDLNVYLATGDPDGELGDFIDLGDLKGNIGDQNYEIGADVDLTEYDSVFVWCVRFGVGFGAAGLA